MYKVIKKIGIGLIFIAFLAIVLLLFIGTVKLIIAYPKIFGISLIVIIVLIAAYAIGNDIEKQK